MKLVVCKDVLDIPGGVAFIMIYGTNAAPTSEFVIT